MKCIVWLSHDRTNWNENESYRWDNFTDGRVFQDPRHQRVLCQLLMDGGKVDNLMDWLGTTKALNQILIGVWRADNGKLRQQKFGDFNLVEFLNVCPKRLVVDLLGNTTEVDEVGFVVRMGYLGVPIATMDVDDNPDPNA